MTGVIVRRMINFLFAVPFPSLPIIHAESAKV